MKTFRLITASLFFAVIFSVSVFAQTATGKVGLINTLAFEGKGGITKYITALTSLDTEFKKDFDDLSGLYTRIQTLEKELGTLQTQLQQQANNPAVPVANPNPIQVSYNTKTDEYGKLGREYKFKQDDAKARYERRRQVILGPISQDIGKAIEEFAKSKGFSIIFDGAKLEEAGVLLGIGDDKVDITKDFIAFYNARPATAAVTTPTK
jgi:Skp family chaperone for outer membrane proteins